MNVARLMFLQVHQAWHLALYLLCPDLTTVIHVTVTTRLDYCNTLCMATLETDLETPADPEHGCPDSYTDLS